MTASRILLDCLNRWNLVSGLNYRLMDPDQEILAETDGFVEDPSAETVSVEVQSGRQETCMLIVSGYNEQIQMIAELAVCQLETLMRAYQDKNDKYKFWKELLEGKYSEMESRTTAKQFRISYTTPYELFLIEMDPENHGMAISLLRNIFSLKDIIFSISDKRIVVLKEKVKTSAQEKTLEIARMLVDMLNTELMVPAKVSYGNISGALPELSGIYQTVCVALEIGKIFYSEQNVFSYDRLGIGRLLYRLPKDVCEQFIKEAFSGENPRFLDDEMLMTIRIFFENNLNLSETARKLYIHRNTLVYRFEKLQKKYGLDIRVFEDAMTFKIGMMVADYLTHELHN